VIDGPDQVAIEARLDELQRESVLRQAELKALAAALPAVTSRRAMTKSMVASIVHAPDKLLVVKRVVLKVLRTPVDLFHRARAR
jgi:hypothetical protein